MARPPRRRYEPGSHRLDPILSRGIIAVLLVVTALLVTLSFLDKAGTLGVIIDEWILSFLFGSIRYITPLVLVTVAIYIVKDRHCVYRSTHIVGAILLYLAVTGLMHLRFPTNDMWRQALEGHGGGIVGLLAWPLKNYIGTIGSGIILVGLLFVSGLLLFRKLIEFLAVSVHRLLAKISINTNLSSLWTADKDNRDNNEYAAEDAAHAAGDEDDRRFHQKPVRSEEADENEETEETKKEKNEPPTEFNFKHPSISVAEHSVWSQPLRIPPLPQLDLLSAKKSKPTSGDINQNQKIIQNTLAEFRITVSMHDIRIGPTVTQYALKPDKGVKLSRITALSNDLALALAAHPIRIEAPIPGKSLVGIEVPNEKAATVTLKELLESKEHIDREHNLMIALGRDVAGKAWFADLPAMPHLLIAGATGSGKTVCMHGIVMSLLFQNTPETLRMIMVDPKRVELTIYNGIPHLLAPVITNTSKTINALKWLTGEMDRRFELLSATHCRDITSYNKKYGQQKMPHIVFFIDELADLMATAANDVEAGIIRIAQLARAVGIHMVVATQRPSVDVITGLMKANIPGRISFSVASLIDSRTILDTAGAEKLIGRGDMLYLTAALGKPIRIQGAFISEQEVKIVVNHLRGDEPPNYGESVITGETSTGTLNMFGGPDDDQDELFAEAKQAVIQAGKASASFLQRKLKIGYARAARILDELESAGIIGPGIGAKPREILTTMDNFSPSSTAGREFNVFTEEKNDFINNAKTNYNKDSCNKDSNDNNEDLMENEEEEIENSDDDSLDQEIDSLEAEDFADNFVEDENEDEENNDEEKTEKNLNKKFFY